jgi:hypothetical protein
MKNIITSLFAVCLGVSALGQTTVNFIPDKDNSIYSDQPNNSNGLGSIYAGSTCFSAERRGLMHFDVSSIPLGASITSVTLTMNCSQVSASNSATIPFEIIPLTTSFGEGASTGMGTGALAIAPDATWTHAETPSNLWGTPGGDVGIGVSVTSLSLPPAIGTYVFPTTADFVNLVQAWVDNPANNHGVLLFGTSLTCSARVFGSKDQGVAPVLTVSYSPPCTTPPTAICADVTVGLDGSGMATILDSDLNGGSLDNCSTTGLTFSASQTAFDCNDVSSGGAPGMVISGVFDGPLPGGIPKGVELYVTGDIADLSVYGVSSANNGGGATGAPEFVFPAVSATAGSYIYVTSDSTEFHNFFGFAPDYESNSMLINGDDAVELFENTTVIDVFGDVNVDGTGQPWEYLDGWAYRNNMTGPDGNTFVIGNWTFSGINQLEGGLTNATCNVPFTIGTYMPTPTGTSVTLTVTDGNGNSAQCVATVTVQDIDLPTASNLAPVNVECIGDVPPADILDVTDADDNCSATVTWTGDVSDGLTCPETITRTYNVADPHGNSIDVTQIITVEDITNPTATAPATIAVECIGDVPAADVLVITDEADNCTVAPVVTHVSDVSDGLSCPETITRTYRVTDDCGNFLDVTQTITVEDVTAPAVNGGLSAVSSNCDVTLTAPTGTDNCDGTVTATADVTFPITAQGLTTVTWTYTDACGNLSTETQDVTISAMDVTTSLVDLTITANNAGQTYQWIDCSDDSQIVGETGQSFTATANGDYAVVITDGDGCTDTSACVNINDVSLGQLTSSLVKIYPNPSVDGKFTVEVEGGIQSMEIIDLTGRTIALPINLNEGTVDGSSLAPGKYIVHVVSNTGTASNIQVLIK